jgi:hypothetical protein
MMESRTALCTLCLNAVSSSEATFIYHDSRAQPICIAYHPADKALLDLFVPAPHPLGYWYTCLPLLSQ